MLVELVATTIAYWFPAETEAGAAKLKAKKDGLLVSGKPEAGSEVDANKVPVGLLS